MGVRSSWAASAAKRFSRSKDALSRSSSSLVDCCRGASSLFPAAFAGRDLAKPDCPVANGADQFRRRHADGMASRSPRQQGKFRGGPGDDGGDGGQR